MARTLLVVEDEPSIADLLNLTLTGEGYRLVVVGDGRAALRLLAEGGYDLVLSDVMMPFVDGLGLARAMHTDPALRAIPLILMSAAHGATVWSVPHAAFIPKPFDLELPLTTVARLLGRDQGADPLAARGVEK